MLPNLANDSGFVANGRPLAVSESMLEERGVIDKASIHDKDNSKTFLSNALPPNMSGNGGTFMDQRQNAQDDQHGEAVASCKMRGPYSREERSVSVQGRGDLGPYTQSGRQVASGRGEEIG